MTEILIELSSFLEKLLGKRRFRLIMCLILIAAGFEKSRLVNEYGYCYRTINKYLKAIENNDIASLFEDNVYRQKSELEIHRESIETDFEANPPKTRREASLRIEKLTGIKRSFFRIGVFLKKGALESSE